MTGTKARPAIVLLVPLLYLIFFVGPKFVWDIQPGNDFWMVLAGAIALTFYVFLNGSQVLQFYVTFFVFLPLWAYFLQIGVGISFVSGLPMPDRLGLVPALVITVHFAGLALGAFASRQHRKRPDHPDASDIPTLFFGLGLWVLLTLYILVASLSDWDLLLSNRAMQGEYTLSNALIFMIRITKAATFVFACFLLNVLKSASGRPLLRLVIVFLMLLLLLLTNPANTERYISLSGLIIVAIYGLSLSGKLNGLSLLILSLPLWGPVFLPLTSFLRYGWEGFEQLNLLRAFSGLEFSLIQILIDGVGMAADLPYGNYLISGILILVPSGLFLGKAPSLGIEIAQSSSYAFPNVAVPSFFSAYADFGFAGLLLFSVVLGGIFQWGVLTNHMSMRRRAHGYRIILFGLVPIFVRGDFSTAMLALYAFVAAYELMRSLSFLVWRKRVNV